MVGDPGVTAQEALAAGRRLEFVQVRPSGTDLAEIADLLADGRLRVHIDETLAIEDVAKAHDLSQSGRAEGKVVLAFYRGRMRAIRQHSLGGPEVLALEEVERPEPRPTEVLVRVVAAGVNPVDWKTRKTGGRLGRPPFTVGWDVSGVVEAVANGVTRFAPGDEVYGMPRFPHEAGGYGEYVTAPSRHFARKPDALSHTEAAGLPLAGLTAWQLLADTAQVRPGQRVLVHAAAGGVGHLAVQIAKALGAYVIGTASAGKHDFLRSLGADELVDYRTADFGAAVRDADVVIDSMGGEIGPRSLPTLRRGGLLVTLTGTADPDLAAKAEPYGVRTTALLVEPDHAGMAELSRLVEAGDLRVHIERTFPLAEAAAAHALLETGRVTGKLVLTI